MMIEVLNGGTQTLIQDMGRPGYRHQGIPESGAADRLNFALANWLIGNPWQTAALECAVGGLHLRFRQATMISLCGAQMWAQINGKSVRNYEPLSVEAGDILTLSHARDGCRLYLAVQGGVVGQSFLGSQATYTPAALGGYEGRALKVGDKIGTGQSEAGPHNSIPVGYRPRLSKHIVLRALPGPEFDYLSDESRRQLFVGGFTATAASDRMGSRLKGPDMAFKAPLSMTSSPLLPGTLQIPRDGRPILALADGHCTGGYARALQVIRADLWQLGQIGPGSKVSFRRCLVEKASEILAHRNAYYSGLIEGFAF